MDRGPLIEARVLVAPAEMVVVPDTVVSVAEGLGSVPGLLQSARTAVLSCAPVSELVHVVTEVPGVICLLLTCR
jgi:hypothetical protein